MPDLNALGPVQRRFLGFSIGWNLVVFVSLALVGGACVAVPLVNALLEVATFGASRIDNAFYTEDFWIPVALGIVILFLGLLFGVSWAMTRYRSVVVHDGGLAFYHGKALEASTTWEAVVALTRAQKYDVASRTTRVTYTVHTRDQNQLSFSNSFPQVDALVRVCQDQIDRRVGPIYETRLRQGERAVFGAVALDATAVFVNGQALPWGAVRGVQASPHSLVIQTERISAAGPPAVALAQVPNWWIFVRLAQRYLSPGG